jgi:hypothetical protein
MERPTRRRGLLGPLVLIGLGVIFLLNNLGILSWSVWATLIRLWPVLLIGFGLDLLFGRRSLLGSVLVVLVVATIVVVAIWGYSPAPLIAGTAAATSEEITQPLNGATRADVQIGFGMGNLRVGALSQSTQLVEGTLVLNPGEKVTRDFSLNGDTAVYHLKSQTLGGVPFSGWSGDDHEWDLRLNDGIPTKLQINTGVGTNNIDLSQLSITDLDVRGGVGRSLITMPARGSLQGRVEGGVGEVVVMVPSGMAARIRVNAGLGGVDVASKYQKQGDVYVSSGYDAAQNRLDLRVNGGVGRIIVQEYQAQQASTSSSASILPQTAGAES